jgi:hypothetical protein
MFGMVFGQAELTTKEITIPIDENTEMIDIGNYVDLVSGFYTVQLVYVNLITEPNSYFDPIDFDSEIANPSIGFGYYNWGLYLDGHFCTISNENPVLISDFSNTENFTINAELILRVSGRFDDTDVGLNGDMNEDGTLDVLDVVSLVQEILGGGMGDVGDLLYISL